MKRTYLTSWHFLLILTAVVLFLDDRRSPTNPPTEAPISTWQVFFSPRGGCTEAIVQIIENAKSVVLVQPYSFTSVPIAKALISAHRRGVNVQVILDKSQKAQKSSIADMLVRAAIPTFIDASHAIAHNKVIVVDSDVVATGSFNFTKAAEERNAENLLIIRSKKLAAKYLDNWWVHHKHSPPLAKRWN